MKKSYIQILGLDDSVIFSLVLRFCQAAVGLIGLFFISIYYSPEMQGFYYVFASLIALQSFVELSLYLVISNVSSHEWSRLRLSKAGVINGDPQAMSRLVSLGRFVFKWYAGASFVFFVLAGGGGYWFLSQPQDSWLEWKVPWLLHILFSSLLMWCMPFLSLLEGCNQVTTVAKFKIWQSLASNTGFCVAIALGSNLWAVPVQSLISSVFYIYFLVFRKRNFFREFLMEPKADTVDWKKEILPMQWRLGLQGFISYFLFSLFTPVMFHYHGPVVAGQMGMSFQLLNAVQSVASVWILTKAPRFAILIAHRDFKQLNEEGRKATVLGVSVMLVSVVLLVGIIYIMTELNMQLANRILPPFIFAFLAIGAVFSLWGSSFSIYLRAHKKEILLSTGILSGVIMGLLVWQLGSRFGPLGASASYMFVLSCVSFPMVFYYWKKAQRDWH